MLVITSLEPGDQDSTVRSEALAHPGGLIDMVGSGTWSGATLSLLWADSSLDPATVANYSLAHADAVLTADGNWQGSLPPGFVVLQLALGDGSTDVDGFVNAVDPDRQRALKSTGVTPS